MGLRIRQTPSRKVRVISISIAAFVLVAQPMTNLMQIATANAISPTTTVVRPGAMNGWSAVDDNGNGGSLSFSATPSNAPLGDGSAQLKVNNASQGYMLFKAGYGGTKLADLTALSYKTNITTGTNLIAPSMQINIDRDTTDGNTSWQGRLVYEPYMNSAVHDGQWQTWNPLAGKWWLSKADKFDGLCGQANPCTIAQLTGHFANIGVNSGDAGIGFKAGSSWSSFTGSVDDFTINQDRYDFEPANGPALVSPTNNNIVSGAMVVNQWSPVDGAVKYVYESYKNAAATQLRWHEETTATQKSAANVANGTTFWWRVKAIDADGNVTAWSPLGKVTGDTVAPTVPTGGQPNGTIEPTNEFDFTWNASIDASPVTYEYQSTQNPAETGGVLTTSLWKSGVLSTPMIHSSGAGDGVWYWQVRATDSVGNKSAWSPIWHMTIDSNAPTVSIDSPTASFVTGTVTVSGSMNDANPDHYYFVVKNSNGTVVAGPKTVNSTTVTSWLWNTASVPEGNYTIVLEARDKAGHKDASSVVKKVVTVDRSAPTTMLSSPFAGQVVGGNTLELKGTVTDPSGVSEYRYQLLDSNKDNTLGNSIIGGHNEVTNDTLGSIDISNLPSGDYYVRLWAKDGLGNTSAPAYVKFTVDHTAPVVTLQADNANPMASTSVTFSGMVAGGSDLSSLKLYSGNTEIADVTNTVDSNGNWSYEFPTGFAMGDYTFRIEATDIFGNKSDELVSPQSVLALSFSQYLPGRGAGIPSDITRQLTQALTLPGTVVAAIPAANTQNGSDQDVLGTQTEKDSAVKGAADKLAAIAPTENGWKLFGIVWYWWLLILAALSAIVWRLAAWLRREDDVLPA